MRRIFLWCYGTVLMIFSLATICAAVSAVLMAFKTPLAAASTMEEPWGNRMQVQAQITIDGSAEHVITAVCDRGNGVMLYITYTGAVIKQKDGCAKSTAEK